MPASVFQLRIRDIPDVDLRCWAQIIFNTIDIHNFSGQ